MAYWKEHINGVELWIAIDADIPADDHKLIRESIQEMLPKIPWLKPKSLLAYMTRRNKCEFIQELENGSLVENIEGDWSDVLSYSWPVANTSIIDYENWKEEGLIVLDKGL
jgi:hypothetical protein